MEMRVVAETGVIGQYANSSNFGPRRDVFPDGSFLMLRGADRQATREIVVVQNFFQEVMRLASPR
jgi:hypothetical protein